MMTNPDLLRLIYTVFMHANLKLNRVCISLTYVILYAYIAFAITVPNYKYEISFSGCLCVCLLVHCFVYGTSHRIFNTEKRNNGKAHIELYVSSSRCYHFASDIHKASEGMWGFVHSGLQLSKKY